ncbi:hypothetical protein ABKV19_025192 [Rosa sericea]
MSSLRGGSSAAETVANIEELLTNILVLVPARSVCGPFQVRLQALSKISGFFSSKTKDESFKSIAVGDRGIPSGNPFKTINDSFGDGSRLKIIQSCNGLFLCLRYSRDISLLRQMYGVYDHPAYVVVCVSNMYGEERHHQIDIYSSETKKWKKLLKVPFFHSPSDEPRPYYYKEEPMHFDVRSREGAVYCNDKIHWIRSITNEYGFFSCWYFYDGEVIRDEGDVSHYFDVDGERLQLANATPPVPLVVGNMSYGFSYKSPTKDLHHRYFGV